MKNLLNPKWLLLVNTLPICILLFIMYGDYSIIKTLLSPENHQRWLNYGAVLGLLAGINLVYALYSMKEKEEVSPIYLGGSFLAYIVYLYSYLYNVDTLFPFDLPQWMVSDYSQIYAGTFLMPTLAYCVLGLVVYFTPTDKPHRARNSFALSIAIPLVWYIFMQVIMPLRIMDTDISVHTLLIFGISSVTFFLFFFVRGIYIIISRNTMSKETKTVLYCLTTFFFPMLGLLVNNNWDSGYGDGGIFGDFEHPLFYILTIINTIFLCAPTPEKLHWRLALFAGKMATFSYTVYFFLVFLPFLPFSIVAIIFAGLGFLMLAPLALIVLHSQELSNDFSYLQAFISPKKLWAISFFCFMLIPTGIIISYWHDKNVLATSLEYIYSPDYSKDYSIDKNSIQKTLTAIQKNKMERWRMGKNIPYLSSFYNWLVLDNMTLSDAKISEMRNVFLKNGGNTRLLGIQQGSEIPAPSLDTIPTESESILESEPPVKITNIVTESNFDTLQNAWISTIHLEITNKTPISLQEYSTILKLPTGAWISDYYLYVGDKKEMGILAEKKAAMWVFSQIRRVNRDPGILHYTNGNKVAFRVFPFGANEMRKTGFELIHKEPISWSIDGNKIQLGEAATQKTPINTDFNKDIFYVSAKEKQQLPAVSRQPYYHFIIDASEKSDATAAKLEYTQRIDSILLKNKMPARNAQISYTNALVKTIPFTNDWRKDLEKQSFEGGFFAERAIKQALYNAFVHKKDSYPIIIIVSEDVNEAVMPDNFVDWAFCYPENPYFYAADSLGKLSQYSLLENSKRLIAVVDTVASVPQVRAFPTLEAPFAYLENDTLPSIALKNNILETAEQTLKEKNWESGLQLQGEYYSQILHPETADKKWLSLIKYSFLTKFLSPYTAYMVVENEAQKAMLLKKQQQVLAGNRNLDLEEERRMSEPNIWLLLFIFLLFWVFRYFYSSRANLAL